ncbi:hypothetical protein K8T06_00710 [bacterium]|nr:hypothetical protein [bacterium]
MNFSELISKLSEEDKKLGYLFPRGIGKIEIRYARKSNEKKLAEEFLVNLEESNDELDKRALANYIRLMIMLFKTGKNYRTSDFKMLKDAGGIYEFREHNTNTRLYCFIEETEIKEEIVLTHAAKKPKAEKKERSEINRALKIKKEDAERYN